MSQHKSFFCWILVAICFASELVFDYTGYKLVRLDGLDQAKEQALEEMESDVWSSGTGYAVVQLSPYQFTKLMEETNLLSNYTIIDNNLQASIDSETQRIANNEVRSKAQNDPMEWFKEYRRLSEVKRFFEILERDNPASMRIVKSIGKSHEGRDIFAVHFSENIGKSTNKPKIWVQCLIHAREWISGSVCQYLAQSLANASKQRTADPKIRSVLSRVEIVMIPIVNPDGYEFSWTKNRLWRKNRRSRGTDLNRNFPYKWGTSGNTKMADSDVYCGPSAGSEPETQAVTKYFDYLNKKGNAFLGALDYHSYSQLILRPLGWTSSAALEENFLRFASNTMARAIQTASPTRHQYASKRSSELYINSGTATDWFYGRGAKYSLAIELPPGDDLSSMKGFLLPAEEILGVCQESLAGFIAYADFVLGNPIH